MGRKSSTKRRIRVDNLCRLIDRKVPGAVALVPLLHYRAQNRLSYKYPGGITSVAKLCRCIRLHKRNIYHFSLVTNEWCITENNVEVLRTRKESEVLAYFELLNLITSGDTHEQQRDSKYLNWVPVLDMDTLGYFDFRQHPFIGHSRTGRIKSKSTANYAFHHMAIPHTRILRPGIRGFRGGQVYGGRPQMGRLQKPKTV